MHLVASACAAGVAAALVFGLWFPYPYDELVGGRDLFILVVSVDVVCGPMLTLILFDRNKSRRELIVDLSLIVLVQLAALGLGVNTMIQGRPVYLVFEVDRFRVVTAADIQKEKLKPELGGLQRLSWTGPKIIGVRGSRNGQETLESLDLSLRGVEPSSRPDWWQQYSASLDQVKSKTRDLSELRAKRPDKALIIEQAIQKTGLAENQLGWMPLTSFRSLEWVVLVNRQTADVVSYAPVDGF